MLGHKVSYSAKKFTFGMKQITCVTRGGVRAARRLGMDCCLARGGLADGGFRGGADGRAEGRALGEILDQIISPTDISGSLVGAFRRAKDLAGQLRGVWQEEDPELASALRDLIRSVSRDEVEVVD